MTFLGVVLYSPGQRIFMEAQIHTLTLPPSPRPRQVSVGSLERMCHEHKRTQSGKDIRRAWQQVSAPYVAEPYGSLSLSFSTYHMCHLGGWRPDQGRCPPTASQACPSVGRAQPAAPGLLSVNS